MLRAAAKRRYKGVIKRVPAVELRKEPDRRGPARCIRCLQPFRKGEVWKRMTSPPDPEFGTYSFGIHRRCEVEK